jgi:hypothetical protein
MTALTEPDDLALVAAANRGDPAALPPLSDDPCRLKWATDYQQTIEPQLMFRDFRLT